jgi:myo-inositol-1(or 4)-monophosphatase
MMNDELARRLELAKATALKQGQELRSLHGYGVRQKKLNDYVTDADSATERRIIEAIKAQFPEDGIFGEENGELCGRSGRWIIDPIDGTVDFFRGIPDYTISIAYETKSHEPLLGVVYCVAQDELFWAMEGCGAWVNDKPIHVSDVDDPSRAILVISPPHRHKELTDRYLEKMKRAFLECSDIRSFGSAALEMCYIASGRLDGYFEYGLGYYDFAGGWAILRQAGGSCISMDSSRGFEDHDNAVIATNGLLEAWLKEKVGD